jgi:hypothetical protein
VGGLILFLSFLLYSQMPGGLNISSGVVLSTSLPIVNIVYPWEGKDIGGVNNEFIFGNVVPYVPTITVNGNVVNVYKTGGFLAYLPIDMGEFKFVVCAENNYGINCTTRTVVNGKKTDTASLFEIFGSTSIYIMKGDSFFINLKAIPSSTIYYEVNDICDGYMDGGMSGYYYTSCTVPYTVKNKSFDLLFKYKGGKYNGEKIVFKNFINIIDKKYLLETSTDNVVIKNETGGYILFLPEGVKLLSDRKEGNKYRVDLGEIKLWVDDDKVIFKGYLNKKFRNETGTLKFIKQDDSKTLARLYISDKVPYRVYEEDGKIYLKLFYINLRQTGLFMIQAILILIMLYLDRRILMRFRLFSSLRTLKISGVMI